MFIKRFVRYKFFLVLAILFIVFVPSVFVYADTAAPSPSPDAAALSQRIQELQDKIQSLRSQENSLSSQIAVMDNEVKLSEYKISATKEQISQLSKDITVAGKQMSNLDGSLTNVTKLLLTRIVATYQIGSIQPIQMLLASTDVSNFLTRLNYMRIVQNHDKKLIYDTEQTKNDYATQKNLFEDKKKQIEALQIQLQDYTKQLDAQKEEKQSLLSETQGNEANYQTLLSQAKAQLAAFSGFVQSQGGLNVINADPSWPSDYFSQRDSRWANLPIGSSSISIGEAGCLLTSVAMVLTHKGNGTTPPVIAGNTSYFFQADFTWSGLRSLGFGTPYRTTDRSIIDNALAAGKWVIVGIDYSANTSGQPFHFVAITAKNGSDYNLYDPWRGPNVSFNGNYGGDAITEVITY